MTQAQRLQAAFRTADPKSLLGDIPGLRREVAAIATPGFLVFWDDRPVADLLDALEDNARRKGL